MEKEQSIKSQNFENLFVQLSLVSIRPTNNAIPSGNFEMLSRLNKLDFFLTEWQSDLDYYSVFKNLHKSNSLRRESVSKLPVGMALFVGL